MLPNNLQSLLEDNKWELAIDLIEKIEKPLDDDELSALAWCYSRLAQYEMATKLYDEMIKRQPQMAKWYYAKGYQFYMQKNWQCAVEQFLLALSIRENYFIVKYRISYAYIQLSGNNQQWSKDSFWKAIRHLEDCHTIFASYTFEEQQKAASTYADICALHGKTIMTSERYLDKSIELLKKANSLKEDNDFKYQLAKAYYNKKQYNEALSVLPEVSKEYYVSELKSQILADMGQYDESNMILLKLTRFRRKDYIYRRIAENYLRLNNVAQAESFANSALQSNKRNYKNYYLLGLVLQEKKMYKSALSAFEKARRIKQNEYKLDCIEAIAAIDEINHITNNIPEDELEENSLNQALKTGKVVKYNSDKGYGFIFDFELKENIFFHISNYPFKDARIGQKVTYTIEISEKGSKATNIQCV